MMNLRPWRRFASASAWILANADECFYMNANAGNLIKQHQHDENEPQTGKPAMTPPPRHMHLDIVELESAFEFLAEVDPSYMDEPCVSFLDLSTGKIIAPEDEDEAEELFGDKNRLHLPADLFEDLHYSALDAFVDSLPDGPQRGKLANAIRGKGASRRFKDIVYGGGDVELKHRWQWFETCRKRERIVEWLRDENIEPDWGRDIFEAPPMPNKRADLLRAVLAFVRDARQLPGVRRIALLGSLTTPKAIPKDVDLLVEITDDLPLENLARLARQLLGKTMQTGDGCGTDVFLCNPRGEYLGRTCPWKDCIPGIRRACQAQHCGRRTYLYDDLQNVRLDPKLIANPPLDLWPEIIARTEIPDDVRKVLVEQL